mmetsp:Transcript_37635/g.67782  ORF Transcript_37635/g.67782 Transcript_37635/m.67782 type:complete len:248 (-) Transcript_37635:1851-2594(-)
MLRQIRERSQRTHGNLGLIIIRFHSIIITGCTKRQNNLMVALRPQRTTLQQRLRKEQTPCIRILSCLDIVQRIPTYREGVPEFIIEMILGVRAHFLFECFDVDAWIPPLYHLCTTDGLWMAHVILAEEELTRQVGHFDGIHIGNPDLSILSSSSTHQSQSLEIFTTQSPTTHQENALVRKPRLEILPHNGNLMIIPRSKEGTDIRLTLVHNQRPFVVMHPLINRRVLPRSLDDLLRRRPSQKGTKAR